ncbi:MAG: FHA domain-containing protein [Clostridiales bacterium]|nr:FHA domain-containing protein [Clostridiales bacterium]
MAKVTYENEGENTFFVYGKEENETIDTMVTGQLTSTSDIIKGILPIIQVEINNNVLFKVDITGKISLEEYFSAPVKPETLLSIYKQISEILLEADEYMLTPDVFLLDKKYIFIDLSKEQIYLIALPICRENTVLLKDFFQSMFFQKFDKTETVTILGDLAEVFNAQYAFSLQDFHNKIVDLTKDEVFLRRETDSVKLDQKEKILDTTRYDKSAIDDLKKERERFYDDPSMKINQRSVEVEQPEMPDLKEKKDDVPINTDKTEAESKTEVKKKKGFFGFFKAEKKKTKKEKKNSESLPFAIPEKDKKDRKTEKHDIASEEKAISHQKVEMDQTYKNKEQDFGKTEYYGEKIEGESSEVETGDTVFDGELKKEKVIFLEAVDMRGYDVPRIINLRLRDGYATIGRYDHSGIKCADFNFDYRLNFISRKHIKILDDNDTLKIIDMNSTNGTLLNGKLMSPNVAYILKKGDSIMFSRMTKLTYSVMEIG